MNRNLHKVRLLQVRMVFGILFCLYSYTAEAQAPDSLNFIGRFQYKNNLRIEDGKLAITPLLGPSYTPEMGLTLAGGVMTSFLTNKEDKLIQRSSLPITLGVSVTGAYFFSSKLSSYWLEDKLRIFADIWLKDMPDNYWGVGYDNAANIHKSDTTTAYNRNWWMFNPKFLWQFKPDYFLGFVADINSTKVTDPNPLMQEDEYFLEYGSKNTNVGFGGLLRYDSRDVPINAWNGMYLDVEAMFYSKSMGSDNNYQAYSVDFRYYKNVSRKGNTLAFQTKTRLSYNDVPYAELSQLGTPFDLRGYTWGQYRDKSMLFLLGEYRHTFLKSTGELSDHGAVAWLGTGSIAKSFVDFESWIPSFGFGYRLQVQPRMNVRIDVGIGRETSGIYFNLNEAF